MPPTLFDIPADLDTPVSAFLKLAPFGPRFLLESVEQGQRLGRYSFLGFGDARDYVLRDGELFVDGRPHDGARDTPLLDKLRAALAGATAARPRVTGRPVSAAGWSASRTTRPSASSNRRRSPTARGFGPTTSPPARYWSSTT